MNIDTGSLALGLIIGLIAGIVVAYLLVSLGGSKQIRFVRDSSGKIVGVEYV